MTIGVRLELGVGKPCVRKKEGSGSESYVCVFVYQRECVHACVFVARVCRNLVFINTHIGDFYVRAHAGPLISDWCVDLR